MPQNELIPVALLALELGTDVNNCVKQFGDSVVYDSAGMRAIPQEMALVHIQSVRRAQQLRREQARAAVAAADDGVAALRRQLAARPAARNDLPAVAVMIARDGSLDDRLDDAAKQRAEMTSGELTYHSVKRG